MFSVISRPALGSHPVSCTMDTGLKRQGRKTDHSIPSIAEVELALLFLCSTDHIGRTV
jgi:hypothetical protein